MKEIMQVKNISKEYGKKGVKTRVLNNVSLDIYEGDFIAIMGPSAVSYTHLDVYKRQYQKMRNES